MDSRDPRFNKNKNPEAFKYVRPKESKDWHWSLNLLMFGSVAGGLACYFMLQFTVLYFWQLVLGMVVVGAIAFILQWKHFYSEAFIKKNFKIPVFIYALYNVVGIGLLTGALFLFLNWMGAGGKEVVEKYRIMGVDRDYINDSNYLTVVKLENDAYKDQPEWRCAEFLNVRLKSLPFMEIVFHKGLFGVLVCQGQRTVPDYDKLRKELEEAIETVTTSEDTTETTDTLTDRVSDTLQE